MSDVKKQNFIQGTLILSIAIVVVKIFGFLFKIPLINVIGSEGYGHFSVAYNVYSLLLTISTGGLPVALSKMIAESEQLGRYNQMNETYKIARNVLAVLGIVFALLMIFASKWVSGIMGDDLAWTSIVALSPAMFFVCFVSAYRGFFQGRANMTPTAISQVIEVLSKLFVGLTLAFLVVKVWKKGVDIGSAGAIVGVSLGTALSAFYLSYYKNKHYGHEHKETSDVPEATGVILKKFLYLAIPITISASVMAIIVLLDNSILLNVLQNHHHMSNEEAVSISGIYNAAYTIANLPVAFMPAITSSILPAISAAIVAKNNKQADFIGNTGLKIASLLAMPCAAGMYFLADGIMGVLYFNQSDIAQGGVVMLQYLALVVITYSFVLVSNSILQAHGQVNKTLISVLVAGILEVPLEFLLVAKGTVKIFGITIMNQPVLGAPLSTVFCAVVILVFNTIWIKTKVKGSIQLGRIVIKPFICALVMGIVTKLVYKGIMSVLSLSTVSMMIALVVSILVAVVVYVVMLSVTKCITEEELEYIPKANIVKKVLRVGK